MHKLTLTLACILFTTQLTTMEFLKKFFNQESQPSLENVPIEAAISFIAQCESKNSLRLTCTQLSKMASRRTNVSILKHPALFLSQEALDHYLLYYTALGKTNIVRNLLYRGANPNACEDSGISVIHYATQYEYNEIVTMLMAHPDFVKPQETPRSFMNHIIQKFSDEDIRQMLSEHNFDIYKLLCDAAKNNLYSIIKIVLENGVDSKLLNKSWKSPLKIATANGHVPIMKLLLDKQANPDYCAYHAITKGYTNALQLLIDYNVPVINDLSEYAIQKNHINTIKLLLEHGANVNQKYTESAWHTLNTLNTPLHYAAGINNTKLIEILLAHGAHIDEQNSRGETPLHVASEKGHDKAVNILLAKGADNNKTDNRNNTPPDLARRRKKDHNENILTEHCDKTRDEQSENCTIQ